MKRAERITYLIGYFKEQNPNASSELQFRNPFELLVATILSAQCTDKRVNSVTPALFDRYPNAAAMAGAEEKDILAYISSVSYPNAKARHLKEMAVMLHTVFNDAVPTTTDELTRLPGVGLKTANVVQAVAFGKATMAVDTHVFRVSHRLGIVPRNATTPLAVEKALMKAIPTELISTAHHWLLLHGRYVCKSQHPNCAECGLKAICPKLMNHPKL